MTNDPRPWQQPHPQPAPQPGKAKKDNTVAVIALGAIALSVLVCGGVFIGQVVTGGPEPKATTAAPRNFAALPTTEAVQAPADTAPTVAVPTTAGVPSTPAATPSRAPSSRPVPSRTTVKPKSVPTTKKPQPRPTTTKPKPRPTKTQAPPKKVVSPGAFCSPEGARGVSKTGKAYRCTRKAGEDRARWRRS